MAETDRTNLRDKVRTACYSVAAEQSLKRNMRSLWPGRSLRASAILRIC